MFFPLCSSLKYSYLYWRFSQIPYIGEIKIMKWWNWTFSGKALRFTKLSSVFFIYNQGTFANDSSRCFLVELALARLDSKDAGVSFFFLCVWAPTTTPCSQAFLAETVETGDKNGDDFRCMQMSLVMSMRFIFGDEWNDVCKLITFLLFGNDVIFPESRPLIFVLLCTRISGEILFSVVYWSVTCLGILSQLL